MLFRIFLGIAGAALVVLPLGLSNGYIFSIVGLAMFAAAILLPPAKPETNIDDKARQLGALVVVNGGHFKLAHDVSVAAKLFVGPERISVLDSRSQLFLVIPVNEITSARAERHHGRWFLQIVYEQVEVYIKLQVKGGQANPAPPIGPALGSKGVNIMEFCKRFNAATQDSIGKILPVIISVYKDKSFEFQIKTPPAAIQLLEAAKVKEGSKQPNRVKVGKVSWDQVRAIAENKMPDLNCFTIESAMKMVAGTARSMGITVEGNAPWA